jgi:hypothetical protein
LDEIWHYKNNKPKVASFLNGKLHIKCRSSAQMQELNMLKSKIFELLENTNLSKKVAEIRFTLDLKA